MIRIAYAASFMKKKEKSVKKNVSRVVAGKRQRNEKEFI